MPDFRGAAWEDIPVADVLHQRSGHDIREASLKSDELRTRCIYAVGEAPDTGRAIVDERDRTLLLPDRMLHALQVNLRGGRSTVAIVTSPWLRGLRGAQWSRTWKTAGRTIRGLRGRSPFEARRARTSVITQGPDK